MDSSVHIHCFKWTNTNRCSAWFCRFSNPTTICKSQEALHQYLCWGKKWPNLQWTFFHIFYESFHLKCTGLGLEISRKMPVTLRFGVTSIAISYLGLPHYHFRHHWCPAEDPVPNFIGGLYIISTNLFPHSQSDFRTNFDWTCSRSLLQSTGTLPFGRKFYGVTKSSKRFSKENIC